jgi:exosortase/archaeosortase family protein
LISLALFGLARFGWIEAHVVLPVTLGEAALAARMFGSPALPIGITLACSGADALSLCLGAVLAYPAPRRRRMAGAAGALAAILALNVARIGTLGRAAASPSWFNTLHVSVWPAVITLAIGAYVLMWMRAPARAASTAAETPQLTRRFVLLAGVLLLVFIAAAPIYLNSAAVVGVASFIARSAAVILGAAGIQAHAVANTLWMPHGGFSVTEECVSTPLIPLYFALVAAYAPSWKLRALGLAAAAPVFVGLGIVRLLVVALPSSIAAQSFFVHAFYQLFAGVSIVFAAAVWRHRRALALAWGTAGAVTGALFIAVAAQGYLRALAAVVTLPSVDPQGAIAFLPGFQAAMYLALWVAAGGGDGWKRLLAGLGLLATSQLIGLIALNAVMSHSAMTMAVRDVRGWALAAPVLVFAAMVSLGRPRR